MATNNCRTTVKRLDCGNDLENQHKNVYEPFSVCLPFGRQLVWDGQGLRLTGTVNTADGQYGLFTVENGCITKAEEQPACEYTAQPCTPAASPCGDTSGSVVLQPGEDNLLNYDAASRLGAQLNYTTSTDGLSITGYGTVSSPLTIDYTPGETARTYVQAGSAAIGVTGTGTATAPYVIAHKSSSLGAGTYGGFTIDDFGHVTGYEDQGLGVTAIQAGNGIKATTMGTIVSLSLDAQQTFGSFLLGGYTLTTNGQGVVTNVTQSIALDVGDSGALTLDPILNTLTFNEFGSLIDYTPREKEPACDQFVETFEVGRETTTMSFTTTKSAYFKFTYRGRLPVTFSGTNIPAGYGNLPSPYNVTLGNRRMRALAKYEQRVTAVNNNVVTYTTGITEVVVITDAFYSAGTYTVSLNCTTEDFTFPDGAILTVELIGRGNG